MRARRAGVAAAAAVTVSLSALIVLLATSTVTRGGFSRSLLQMSGEPQFASLNYMSGPVSMGPASAHMDFGEPDVGAYLKDVSERGPDPSIALKSPSSVHSEPYHGGVNRWREARMTPWGTVYPTFWGTSAQDARPVASSFGQGEWPYWGRGWGPNHYGDGKEGAPRWPSVVERQNWRKAQTAYASAAGYLNKARIAADRAHWAARRGFFVGVPPRTPQYADDAYLAVDHAAEQFAPREKPRYHPYGDAGMRGYYSDYWKGRPEPYYYYTASTYPAAFPYSYFRDH
jgi:hypothetical protein